MVTTPDSVALNELLEAATEGQLKHLLRPSTFRCNVQNMGRKSRDSDLAPLITQKGSVRFFTWGQVQLLRRSVFDVVPVNVPKKALAVLKRKSRYDQTF